MGNNSLVVCCKTTVTETRIMPRYVEAFPGLWFVMAQCPTNTLNVIFCCCFFLFGGYLTLGPDQCLYAICSKLVQKENYSL